jgi:mRNA interferase RelE/StbE
MEIKFQVVYHRAVIKDDIPKLDVPTRQRIKKSIEDKLMTFPETYGMPLRRSLKGHRKLRVGDYRVIFRMEKNLVIILAIMHRAVVYSKLDKRVG